MSTPTSRIARQVLINGIPLAGEVGIMAFSVMQYYNKITSAKLKIQDGSAAKRDFLQSNSELFKPGNLLELKLGYNDNPSTVFKGIIVRHCVKVKGTSYLEVEAKDKAVKLTTSRKSAYFINKTDSQIIDEILGSEVEKEIETTTVSHPEMVQYYCSNWDFIVMRAEANGMFVLTDKGKIIVKKPAPIGVSVLTATYGDNILEFEGEMDARRHFSSITSKSWGFNSSPDQTILSASGSSTFSETGNLDSSSLASVLGSSLELKHSGNLSDAQLSQWANAYSLRSKLSKACGRIRIRGNHTLKPGQKITLAGVGNRFNGEVIITGVLHQFNGDFITDIQFGWSEDWFYKKEDVVEKSSSGLVPGVMGLQIATVKQIHGPPTGKVNHVKIKLAMVQDENQEEGIWARVALLDAGKGRGFIFRPDVGDEVIVGFINDDPRDAVILGMLHSQSKPPPSFLEAEEANSKKGIVTKSGLKVTFDDTNKVLTIAVPSGQSEKAIVIDNQAGSIEIKDEFQNLIKMGSEGIIIKSPKKVVIQGSQKIDLNPVPPIL
ncbi:MAG: type VI secretion system tip protein VgrG [Leadbetterella sp.]